MDAARDPQKLLVGREFEVFQMNLLSFQQARCLLLTAEGFTAGQIATALGLCESTVVSHIESGKDKTGAINKAHYIARSVQLGILRVRGFVSFQLLTMLVLLQMVLFVSMTFGIDGPRTGGRIRLPTARVQTARKTRD